MLLCVVQFLNDYDITYCPEHVFYDVRVSITLNYFFFCNGGTFATNYCERIFIVYSLNCTISI